MKRKKILFVSSTGGHLAELLQLEPLFSKYDYLLVTEKTKSNLKLRDKYNVKYLIYGTRREILLYPFKFFLNVIKSFHYLRKFRPDFIITTGAHTSVPMCYLGKFFKAKVIFIETMANSSSRSLSGRLVYKRADLFIVQWESMLKLYPKAKCFGVLE